MRKVNQRSLSLSKAPDGTLGDVSSTSISLPQASPGHQQGFPAHGVSPEPEIYRARSFRHARGRVCRTRETSIGPGASTFGEFEYKNALRLTRSHPGHFAWTELSRTGGEVKRDIVSAGGALDGALEEEHKLPVQRIRHPPAQKRHVRQGDQSTNGGPDWPGMTTNTCSTTCPTFYAKGQGKQARRLLEKALGVNADFERAKKFLDIMDQAMSAAEVRENLDPWMTWTWTTRFFRYRKRDRRAGLGPATPVCPGRPGPQTGASSSRAALATESPSRKVFKIPRAPPPRPRGPVPGKERLPAAKPARCGFRAGVGLCVLLPGYDIRRINRTLACGSPLARTTRSAGSATCCWQGRVPVCGVPGQQESTGVPRHADMAINTTVGVVAGIAA
jgi:hypothetical protein